MNRSQSEIFCPPRVRFINPDHETSASSGSSKRQGVTISPVVQDLSWKKAQSTTLPTSCTFTLLQATTSFWLLTGLHHKWYEVWDTQGSSVAMYSFPISLTETETCGNHGPRTQEHFCFTAWKASDYLAAQLHTIFNLASLLEQGHRSKRIAVSSYSTGPIGLTGSNTAKPPMFLGFFPPAARRYLGLHWPCGDQCGKDWKRGVVHSDGLVPDLEGSRLSTHNVINWVINIVMSGRNG